MKDYDASWCEVRADGDILIFRTPPLWRWYFGGLGLAFTAFALYPAYLLYGPPALSGSGEQPTLLTLIILFGLLALLPLYLALPYRVQLDFRRQAYEAQRGLSVRHGPFTEIKNSYIQSIRRGSWYRVRLAWERAPVRWSPILSEMTDLGKAEAFARGLAERLGVPFAGIVPRERK